MSVRDYGLCAVCGESMVFALMDGDAPHTYHDEDCPALLTGWLDDCTCGGLQECHAECCPTCH